MAVITDLINAQKIARAYGTLGRQENYLSEILMPIRYVDDFNITTVVNEEKLPVAIRPSNFDADPITKRFGNVAEYNGKKLYFKESTKLNEEDRKRMYELMRVDDGGKSATNFANYRIEEMAYWIEGIRLRAEIMAVSLWTTGKIKVDQDGVTKEIDYQLPTANKMTTSGGGFGTSWTNATATPIQDIKKVLKMSNDNSNVIVMNEKTFDEMIATTEVKNFLNNELKIYMPTETEVADALRRKFGINIIVYKTKGKLKESGTNSILFPDNVVAFMPSTLGFTSYGPTMASIDRDFGLEDANSVANIPKTGGATVKVSVLSTAQGSAINNIETLIEATVAPDQINISKLYVLDTSI